MTKPDVHEEITSPELLFECTAKTDLTALVKTFGINSLIQDLHADFPWKVSIKIRN